MFRSNVRFGAASAVAGLTYYLFHGTVKTTDMARQLYGSGSRSTGYAVTAKVSAAVTIAGIVAFVVKRRKCLFRQVTCEVSIHKEIGK